MICSEYVQLVLMHLNSDIRGCRYKSRFTRPNQVCCYPPALSSILCFYFFHLSTCNMSSTVDVLSTTTPSQDRSRFSFQQPWFEATRPDWEELTRSLRGQQLRVLEVGAFEGASTTWILDNLLIHPKSTMTVIDTFAGGMEHQGDVNDTYGLTSLKSRFWSNVSQCKHVSKLNVMEMTSDEALITLRKEGARFDFVYIDASHVALDVLHDAVLCWRMLDMGGTLVFDDFAWKGYNEDCYNPRVAILSFLLCAAPELQAKETELQLWVTKVPNHISATKNPDPAILYWDKPEGFKLPVVPVKIS